uniref:Coiled-coil domain-containing protein 47 n=1 Tax=Chromera velia CCMP2878 TaxID=1169474 RepID=A0A0G4FI12_9ALVE|eukprot:Cvel_17054.t1-p1 / transcript=Cvel_17054.t1 / gene=Cvel_17054 / organism=Chromera_velia_CCMP2878 / gene_product=Coiled-coil domain-containing protein 47, putative / transcript_product=Coiled-coil domain-containing protein 47, putative / location=Cvel_scaffold1343:17418-20748(-) / protein_length=475 / sequence_SO=supercontig / SO=protein_coding / is_pseudo=false
MKTTSRGLRPRLFLLSCVVCVVIFFCADLSRDALGQGRAPAFSFFPLPVAAAEDESSSGGTVQFIEEDTQNSYGGDGDPPFSMPSGGGAQGQGRPGGHSRPPPMSFEDMMSFYWRESLVLGWCVLSLVLIFTGSGENQKIAEGLARGLRESFAENFSFVDTKEGGNFLELVSYDSYEFFCTGRRNCYCVTGTFELKPRQDLLTSVFLSLIGQAQGDMLRLRFELSQMDPLVVAVCRNKSVKKLHEDCIDLKDLARSRTRAGLPSSLSVLADNHEGMMKVLSDPIVKGLAEHERLIQHLIVSSEAVGMPSAPSPGTALQRQTSPSSSGLNMSGAGVSASAERSSSIAGSLSGSPLRLVEVLLKIPPGAVRGGRGLEELVEGLTFCFTLVDRVAAIRLDPRVLQQQADVRKKAMEAQAKEREKEREEEKEKKRQEKKREEEEAYEKMTPEQRRKFDEKKEKKENKRKNPRMKVMKGI